METRGWCWWTFLLTNIKIKTVKLTETWNSLKYCILTKSTKKNFSLFLFIWFSLTVKGLMDMYINSGIVLSVQCLHCYILVLLMIKPQFCCCASKLNLNENNGKHDTIITLMGTKIQLCLKYIRVVLIKKCLCNAQMSKEVLFSL